jgi:hypothetical protein
VRVSNVVSPGGTKIVAHSKGFTSHNSYDTQISTRCSNLSKFDTITAVTFAFLRDNARFAKNSWNQSESVHNFLRRFVTRLPPGYLLLIMLRYTTRVVFPNIS